MREGITVTGATETAAALLELPREVARHVRERTLRKAAMVVVNAAKGVHPPNVVTGAWEESIGVQLWPDTQTREMFNIVMAIIGSRRGARYQERSNIAHLLEFGWRTVRGGTLGRKGDRTAPTSRATGQRGEGTQTGRVEGYGVFRKAAAASEGAARQIIVSDLPKAVKRAWKRLRRAR